MKFEELIFIVEQYIDCGDCSRLIKIIQSYFGLSHLTYVCPDIVIPENQSNIISSSTYPSEWQTHYLESGYLKHDLAVKLALDSLHPIDWTNIKTEDPLQARIFGEANEFGIKGTGLSFPIRGTMGEHALITVSGSFSGSEWARFKSEHIAEIHILSTFLHSAMLRLHGVEKPKFKLSKRELECLYWASHGKTYEDVATIIGISPNTVKLYFTTVRHKLNCITLTQAVAKAISLGIIPPVI